MKKFLMFALVAMVAGMASAQTLTWIGNGAVYNVEEDSWYGTGASWASTAFVGYDFGTLASWNLTLGGQVQTWIDNNSHDNTMTVNLGYGIDNTYWSSVSLPYSTASGNNDVWENMTGVDVIAASGTGVGTHSIQVYYSATQGATTIYDNNGGGNYASATYTQAIPEPATMSLLGLGALAMVLRRKMSK